MANEFLIFQKRLERVRSIYFQAYCEYVTFNEIEKLRASDLIEQKDVDKNLELMNHFSSFFQVVIEALRISFLSKLAKLLDNDTNALHIDKLINYVEQNKGKLNAKEFSKYNTNRAFLTELTKKYKGISKEDIIELRVKLGTASAIRSSIKIYRDKHLSHEDIKQERVDIQREDVDKIFSLIGEVLNFLSLKTDFSTTTYKLAKENCEKDVGRLINYLKKGRTERIREIKKRFGTRNKSWPSGAS